MVLADSGPSPGAAALRVAVGGSRRQNPLWALGVDPVMETTIKLGVLAGVTAGLLIPALAVGAGAMATGSSGMMMPGMMHDDGMMGSMMGMDADEMHAMHQACLVAMAHHHGDGNETQPTGGT